MVVNFAAISCHPVNKLTGLQLFFVKLTVAIFSVTSGSQKLRLFAPPIGLRAV